MYKELYMTLAILVHRYIAIFSWQYMYGQKMAYNASTTDVNMELNLDKFAQKYEFAYFAHCP